MGSSITVSFSIGIFSETLKSRSEFARRIVTRAGAGLREPAVNMAVRHQPSRIFPRADATSVNFELRADPNFGSTHRSTTSCTATPL
jgi:hypothetical protein